MPQVDPDEILKLLRDPNVESLEIATATGVPREEAGRAARLVAAIAKAKPEEALTLPGPLASAVIRAALEVGRVEFLAALVNHPVRDVAKEAKRALHLLKTRGVSVPELPRATPAPAAPPAEPPFSCFASTVDSQGERALWITRSVPGKGVEVGQAIVSDTQGLLELQIGLLGRKEFRTFAREIMERGVTMAVVELDREAAKALVAEARALTTRQGGHPPEGSDAWLSRLGPAQPLPDPAAAVPALPEAEAQEAVATSASLHELPLMRAWLAEDDVLRVVAQKLDEIAVSPLYIDDQQKAEQSTRAISEAVDSYLSDEPRRARLAARLFTVSVHLAAVGEARGAKQAAAVAYAVRAGQPAAQLPFVRLLLEKAFARPQGETADPAVAAPGPSGAPPSLIVKPGDP
jgi:hypothetical protein